MCKSRQHIISLCLLISLTSSVYSASNLDLTADRALNGKKGIILLAEPKSGRIIFKKDPFHLLQKKYLPGSTVKIVTAFAALSEGKLLPEERINCPGKTRFGKSELRCWNEMGHGPLAMRQALAQSCNIYFLTVGWELGEKSVLRYFKSFTLDPKQEGQRIDRIQGALIAIGESPKLLVTPLKMLKLILPFANGGTFYEYTLPELAPTKVKEMTNQKEIFAIIRDGLIEATVVGTAKGLKGFDPQIAGKTGTPPSLREKNQTDGWFIGFAPAEQPKIAFVILVENGQSYADAVPVAKEILSAYFAKP